MSEDQKQLGDTASGRNPDLLPRLVFGLAMAAVALAALWYGGWPFLLLIALVGVLSCLEWTQLTLLRNQRVFALLMSVVLLIAMGVGLWRGWAVGVMLLSATAVGFLLVAAIRLDRPGLSSALGLLYIGVPVLSLAWLRELPEPRGSIVVLWFFLVIWLTDTAAYFVGRMVGGPKLAPDISPKKTWSGAIGGLLAAGLVGFVAGKIFALPSVSALIIVSLLLSALAQLSDLLESAIKRHYGRKDSGSLIPGHGGVLDRIDSVLLTAPALALALALPGAGAI